MRLRIRAFDSRTFYARYESEWRPSLCARYPMPQGDPSSWTRAQTVHSWYHHPDYYCPEPYEAYPSHLHIDLLERAQGRGFGRRMMDEVMDRLRGRGSPGVHLGVSVRNEAAQGFYRRLGFREMIGSAPAATASSTWERHSAHDLRAGLLGGRPVRTRPFASWPVFGRADEARLLRALRSGRWGRLQATKWSGSRRASPRCTAAGTASRSPTARCRCGPGLVAAGLRAEDEVIVPPYTFFSTASAVVEANMIPVFADIDPGSFNLDPAAAEAAISPRTRAIIPVHFAGQPADMSAIMRIARARKLIVIEDAAHAHGARYKAGPAGSLGHLASFSFQSSKNLTCGEGGIITTNDRRLADACRSLHNCGRVPGGVWYEHHTVSGNTASASSRRGAERATGSARGADEHPRPQRPRPCRGALGPSRAASQERPSSCTRHSYPSLHAQARRGGVRRARPAVIEALRAEAFHVGRVRVLAAEAADVRKRAFGRIWTVPPPGWTTAARTAPAAT